MKQLYLTLARSGGGALLLAAVALAAQAQTGGVRLGTAGTPDPSAVLDLRPDVATTPKGFLPPRLSTGQRDAITNPAPGLTVFNTTTGQLNVWNGSQWVGYLVDTTPQALPTVAFAFTGASQTYTVPAGITRVDVDLAGASGGSAAYQGAPGLGGRVQASLSVTAGQVLTIYVGGAGGAGTGGYNGGGSGFAGGGGATDLRQGGTTGTNRVLVAGGGGGTANIGGAGPPGGGCGGGLTACNGGSTYGTAGAGGGQTGSSSSGGNALDGYGGGGGGGYFGGGGGSSAGGGGGSSFAGAGTSGVVHTQGAQSGNGYLRLTPYAGATVSPVPAPVLDASNFTNLPAAQTLSVSGQNLSISGGNTVAVPGDNLGNHTASQPIGFTTNDADKFYFTQGGGANGSKLAHGAGWTLDYYAGPNTSQAGQHRFFTGTATGWQERLRIDASGNVGIGTSAAAARLDVQGGADSNGANDPVALGFSYRTGGFRHFVRSRHNGGQGGNALDFYLNNSSTAAGSSVPGTGNVQVLTLENNGGPRLGIGTTAPRGALDVNGSSDSYLVDNPNNGSSQTVYLPGHLFLAPYSGTSGTAYVQARVPSPRPGTNIGLTLRTTSAGALVEAVAISPAGDAAVKQAVLARALITGDYEFGGGPDVYTANTDHVAECPTNYAAMSLAVYATDHMDGNMRLNCTNLTGIVATTGAWTSLSGGAVGSHERHCPTGQIATAWRMHAGSYLDGDLGLYCRPLLTGFTRGFETITVQLQSSAVIPPSTGLKHQYMGATCPPGTFLTGISIQRSNVAMENLNEVYCAGISAQ